MSVYLNIVLLLLGYEISNVDIVLPLLGYEISNVVLFYHNWVMKYLMSVYLNIVLPLLGYEISNVGIFKYCFTIIGL